MNEACPAGAEWNNTQYVLHNIIVKKDDPLNKAIAQYKKRNPCKFNGVVVGLLREHLRKEV